MGFGKEVFEDVTLGVEGGQSDGLPRLAGLDIARLGFAHAVDKNERVFVTQNMLSGTRYKREMRVNGSVRVFDLLRLDGEVAHPGCHFLEDAVDEAGVFSHRAGCGKLGLLIKSHPVEEPWVRIVFDADLDVHQHPSAEKSCAVSNAFLCKCQSSSQSRKTKALVIAGC